MLLDVCLIGVGNVVIGFIIEVVFDVYVGVFFFYFRFLRDFMGLDEDCYVEKSLV